MSTPRPRMKQRGGRRRARAQQRARQQKIIAYTEILRHLGYSPIEAYCAAILSVDLQDHWQLPDDLYKSELWTGAAS